MRFKIPITNDAYSEFSTTMNNLEVQMKTRYNSEMGIFLVDIVVPSIPKSVLGIPVTTGLDLISGYNLGIGTLYGHEKAGEITDSTRENFGISYLLLTEQPDAGV